MSDYAYDWDENDQVEEASRNVEAAHRQRAAGYHHVFAQDPIGQKILAEWITNYCTGSPPSANATEREVGMMDGKRELVKMILDQIVKVTGESGNV